MLYNPISPDSIFISPFYSLEPIFLHVFVGYGGDYFGISTRPQIHQLGNIESYIFGWLFLAVFIGLFQGIALKITLDKRILPKSLNLWLGVFIFSVFTNPFTFHFLL